MRLTDLWNEGQEENVSRWLKNTEISSNGKYIGICAEYQSHHIECSDIDEVQKNDCQYVFCIVHDLHVYLSAADDSKYHRHKVKYVSVSKEKNAANNAEWQAGWYTSVGEVTNFHLQFLHKGITHSATQPSGQNSNCFN